MRDLVVLLLITLVGTGAALWILRRTGAAARPADLLPEAGQRAAQHNPLSEDEPRDGTRVAVLEFDSPPWAVTLTAPEVMIGRHSQDDVRIPDLRVSRHHAKLIAVRHGGFEIHNLTAVRSEPNPMLVNGEECAHASLGDGDVVTLGGVSFKLRLAA